MSRSTPDKTPLLLVFAALVVGISCSAISFVFIRESVERSIMLAAWRVLLAALILAPAYYSARKRFGDASFINVVKRSLIPGLILSIHFIAWVIGARLTPGANATLMVNLMPLVMPFFMYFLYQESLQRRELMATGLALIGIIILSVNDVQINQEHFTGDVLCLISMVLFAAYLSLARNNLEAVPSVWLYVVPMYTVAGLCSLLIAAATGPIMPTFDWYNLLMVFLLAALSTVIGHTALNYAMKRLRGQTVTLMNLSGFAIAGYAGYLVYDEVPTRWFYLAGAFIVSGIVIVALKPKASSGSAQKS